MNADETELRKFSDLAHRWWDPASEFKPLHDINPLRLDYIDGLAALKEQQVLDVGCGGGILSEGMAARGAMVTGIDLSEKAIKVAKLHLLGSGIKVDYRVQSIEEHGAERPHQYDVLTCMELLEHVPDPAAMVKSCAGLLKPGGHCIFSTINRNLKSYLFAVVGAEYLLRLLPRGTHDYARFIKPSELARHARAAGMRVETITGMSYNPLAKTYSLGRDTDVNYFLHARAE